MHLIERLDAIENMPNRYSNLAFWRNLRNFKDEIVGDFTYIHEWGKWVESINNSQNETLGLLKRTSADIETEQVSQNDKISALEDNVKTLNGTIELVEKEQSAQSTDITSLKTDLSTINGTIETIETNISTIQKDQLNQDLNIATNSDDIAAVNTNLNAIVPLVYDGTIKFKSNSFTDTNASVSNIAGDLHLVNSTSSTLELESVPFHVTARAYISIFTNADQTTSTTVAIPIAYVVTPFSGKTRITTFPTPFYAPYGVNRLTGLYITYTSHA